MPAVTVQIVELISEEQPGFVAAEFVDAFGAKHTFHDKVPVFGCDYLHPHSSLPVAGWLGCEIDERFKKAGRDLVWIDTEKPWDIESTDGLYRFVVPAEMIIDI